MDFSGCSLPPTPAPRWPQPSGSASTNSGALVQTLTIPAPGSSTPSTILEGTLSSSWNVQIPGSLIQPNTSMLVDVDPDNSIGESNEGDNSFPASGIAQAINVQAVSSAIVRLVPIRQTANGLVGSVGSADQALDLTRRMYPLGNGQHRSASGVHRRGSAPGRSTRTKSGTRS